MPFFSPRRRAEAPDDEPIELAAVADGSLSPDERATVDARLAESPELAALLAEQEQALGLIRNATATTEAPGGLRTRIEAQRSGRRRLPRPLALGTGLATAAVVALVLLVVLPGGAGGPSLAEAASFSARPATDPAPPPQAGQPKLLDREVGGVPFPSWQKKFGWRTTGQRADSIRGRDTATVFYDKQGKRVGYTIVDGKPLKIPGGASPATRNGVQLHTFRTDGRLVVTWLRHGRTCILAARGVPRDTLLKLAAWKGKGAVGF